MKSVANPSELLDLEHSLDEVVADLVEELKQGKGRGKTKRSPGYGTRQMQATYLEICRNALNPVVRYIKAISLGVVTLDMIEVMLLIVAPLVKKTKEVGLDQHARKLRSFHIVLQQIARSGKKGITAAQHRSLEEVYYPVYEAFELNMRGHAVAVANLLSFYRKVKNHRKITDVEVRKLFSIGVPSISMIRKSSLEELTSLTGIPNDRVAVIRALAREFQLLWFMG